MPRIKKATDANGTVFYPITISKGVYDTDNNQRLSTTLGWFNTGSSAYATCTSAASTVAKRASVQGADGWRLYAGDFVSVTFTHPVNAGDTLNISSTGGKNIYFRGAAITTGVILAGDTVVMVYDGTGYRVLCIDRLMIPVTYASSSEAIGAAEELT